jgi:hypothetical protein
MESLLRNIYRLAEITERAIILLAVRDPANSTDFSAEAQRPLTRGSVDYHLLGVLLDLE